MKEVEQKVAFYKLFGFADSLDVAAVIVGTAAAIGNGLAQPLMAFLFGHLVNSLGATDSSHVVHEVSKVILSLFSSLLFYTNNFFILFLRLFLLLLLFIYQVCPMQCKQATDSSVCLILTNQRNIRINRNKNLKLIRIPSSGIPQTFLLGIRRRYRFTST